MVHIYAFNTCYSFCLQHYLLPNNYFAFLVGFNLNRLKFNFERFVDLTLAYLIFYQNHHDLTMNTGEIDSHTTYMKPSSHQKYFLSRFFKEIKINCSLSFLGYEYFFQFSHCTKNSFHFD